MLKKALIGLVVCCAIAAGFVRAQQPTPQQPQASASDRYTVASGTFRFEGSPELSTFIKLDTTTGETWYLAVQKTAQGNNVQWYPIPPTKRAN